MKRILALPLALAITATAWAHNGMEHVMGTVAAITAYSLNVKTTAGKLTGVVTDSKTVWMRGKTVIKASDVHTGDRVVIHAKKQGDKLLAAEVEVGTAH